MAHLWLISDSNVWTPRLLAGDTAALVGSPVRVSDNEAARVDPSPRILLRRLLNPPNTWAVIASSPILRLNGALVPLGIAVLEDRDEIRLPDFTAWFSTEVPATVEPFPESTSRSFCPRCKQAIAASSAAVRCPGCALWHHASEDLPCWTYAPTCSACAQDTALDAGFRWTPEDL